MRPLSLTIEGLRSFRSVQTIDFTDLSFFAILGDTGAGKTSILEAISYALFNSSTWSGTAVRDLLSTGSRAMRVEFTFSIGGRRCTVTRVTPLSGVSNHLLVCDGDPPARCDNESAVNQFIANLGLRRDTFLKTVVLPQGRFSEFLLMKGGERSRFLSDVLNFDVLDDVGDALRSAREQLRLRVETLRAARKELPDDCARELAEAKQHFDAACSRLDAIEAALRTIGKAQTELSEIATAELRESDWLSAETAARASLEALSRIADCESDVRSRLARAEQAVETAADDVTRAKAAKERLEREGRDVRALRDADNHLVNLRRLYDERAKRQSELEREGEAASALQREADQKRQASLAADEAYAAAESALKSLSDRAHSVRERVNLAANARRTISERLASRLNAQREVEKRASAAAEASEKAIAATAQAKAASEAFADARLAMDLAARADAAAHAAHGLRAGDACPICRRELPQNFRPPVIARLDELQALLLRAERTRDETTVALAKAETLASTSEKAAGSAGVSLTLSEDALQATIDEYELLGFSSSEIRNSGIVDALKIELEEAESEFNARGDEAREIAQHRDTARAQLSDAQRKLSVSNDRVARFQLELENNERDCTDETALLPSYVTVAAPTSEAIDESRRTLRDQFAFAEKLDAELGAAIERQNDAKIEEQQARLLLGELVDQPRAEAFRVLDRFMAIDGIGAMLSGAFDDARNGKKSLAEFSPLLAITIEAFSENSKARRAQFADERTLLSEHIARIVTECGASDVAGVGVVRDDALQAKAVGAKAARDAERDRDRASALDAQLHGVEPTFEVFGELADMLTPAKFPQFVVDRKQRELLEVGTTVLSRMTNGRFGFSKQFGIVDLATSQERKPQTLSGGETFLASLALSLALVEIAERSGVRFESLFLDEGFGTLDPAAFELALTELQHQVAQGRMIAVITHVARVTEFIDVVLRVTKSVEGSAVSIDYAGLAAG